MNGQRKTMRYAHAEGHTDICYSDDGKHLLTCGSDGDVRIWTGGIEDDDPSSECVGEMALALAYRAERFFVSNDNNHVQAYTFPEKKRDGIVARFSAPVTHIDVSDDGTLLASASCDMEIQVTELETNKLTKFSGHTAPVLGVALDPRKKFVVSSSCDGSIKIWEISTGESVKTFPNMVPVCNDFFRATSLNRPAWQSKSGNYLALIKEKEVQLYERDSWDLKYQLTDGDIKKPLSIVLFSPCGNYVAASSTIGEIIIWNILRQKKISYTEHPKKASICGIAWHPEIHEIAFCDRLGELGVLENFMETGETENDEPAETTMTNGDDLDGAPEGLFDDDDDENAISLDKIKASTGWVSPSKRNEDKSSINNDDSDSRQSDFDRKMVPLTDLQNSFQPSSTPSHFQHRFMLWNSIGVVRCFNTEEEKSIDVEFHDTIFHHALHMNNYEEYTMASLSKKVLTLASVSTEENPSKLTCVVLNAWDGSKEWSLTMPEDENIQAITAAGNWVAAATDSNYLRIYSHAGTQRQILSIPGPVVSMAGHEQLLLVVCHVGMGLPGCQNLNFILYEITPVYIRAITPCQPVPLFPKSTLKWIGFTDEGTPCVFDSEGILRFLSRDYMHWIVGCDTHLQRKSKLDHYFIIGVSEKYQNVRCILCKGSYYPMTTPRPTVIEIPLKLPLNEPESEKSTLEDTFWRLIFSLPILESLSDNYDYKNEAADMDKTLKQTVIKLFANACRSDADMRAIDVASFMSEKPLETAVKYASKLGRMYLADKLSNVDPIDWSKLNEQRPAFFSSRFLEDSEDFRMDFNKKNVNYSQDIFEDSSQSASEGNRLLAVEREKYDSTENTVASVGVTPARVNPFKAKNKGGNGPKGLNFFDTVKPEEKKKVEISQEKPIVKPRSQNKEKSEKSNSSQPKKQTFVQWFALQKASLQKQHPELTPNELTKTAMKIFKAEGTKVADENSTQETQISMDSQDSQETQITESKKRKLDDNESTKTEKQSVAKKLSLFAFNK